MITGYSTSLRYKGVRLHERLLKYAGEVVIDGITVRQDGEGRYCLNNVHEASGARSTYAPGQWTRFEAAELVEELILGNPTIEPQVSKAGRYGGTFAVKVLVYAYAM